ncbi:hypothetical protein GOC31_30850 [Sinorhizobium meliloti]|nr:hypothetical protein [Sinorhizobium meliloti]MDX0253013.1 hypothetical protein [Sinorhizobium meliloti]
MFAKQGSQVRRSTPANLSSVGAARDGAGQAELESLKARLREEMASLMQRAEAWGRAASGADRNDRSKAETEPEECQSFENRADALFGT